MINRNISQHMPNVLLDIPVLLNSEKIGGIYERT